MNSTLLILTLLGPALLAAASLIALGAGGGRPRAVLLASRVATVVSLLCAVGVAAVAALVGPVTLHVAGADPLALSIRVDGLSATMALLVAFLGVVVVQFSRNYLDGEVRQGRFIGRLCLTLSTVLLLVLSGSLLQLLLAWVGASAALHGLLTFYRDRPRAQAAAHKKFLCARAGDTCLLAAAILLYQAYGTGDIARLSDVARTATLDGGMTAVATAGALALVLAAMLKSAQFPFHGWLTEVMETPTPVSALLHAGIVNAGGFLMVRMADVLTASPLSMYLLIVVGGTTALVGTAVMVFQTSVKVSLAWSTVAQMGFMLLQCGLGAFSAAALHIVAHSVYKAHAFLSAGSVAEVQLTLPKPGDNGCPPLSRVLWCGLAASVVLLGAGAVWGVSPSEKPALVALGAILLLGFTHLLANGGAWGLLSVRLLGGVALLSLTYFGLQVGAAHLLAGLVPPAAAPDGFTQGAMVVLVGLFGAISLLQLYAPRWLPAWPGVYVHLANGLYANTLFDRVLHLTHGPVKARH